MNNSYNIRLPFIETIKRSFGYVFCNLDLLLKSISIGIAVIIYEMFSDFSILCSLGAKTCTDSTSQSVSNLLIVLTSTAIIINYCRGVILKQLPDYRSLSFLRRIASYILMAIGLYFAILLLSGIASTIISSVFYFLGYKAIGEIFSLIFVLMMMISAILLSPIFILFAAIAVDDKDLSVKEIFKVAKGNHNKIFWGQVIMLLPCGIIMSVISFLSINTGAESFAIKLLYSVALLLVSFIDSCFKASFFAHIYQYFIFYRNKYIEQNSSESVKE